MFQVNTVDNIVIHLYRGQRRFGKNVAYFMTQTSILLGLGSDERRERYALLDTGV